MELGWGWRGVLDMEAPFQKTGNREQKDLLY
jgi:hypothetical protein